MKLKEILNKIFLIEIIKGLSLTLKMLFSKSVTIQYPFERRKIYPGFRGKHALIRDPFTNNTKCIGCMRCSTVCPSRCIYIKREKVENKMAVTDYIIDASRCVFCAYCVEACPVCALVLTEDFEYSTYSRNTLIFNKEQLLKNWDEFVQKWPQDLYFNKFWQPPGIDPSRWPKAKREQKPIPLRRVVEIKKEDNSEPADN
ncbi:MAG TPA: NADH-quinone oxidoreductase subunit I [Thermodesulfovibrio thiophilus]|nr:NADH-quinone oxidoreductase subunit I [Thermodesulfovibrio thiophilus]HQD35907.1 NADH-quinone oxidoreductase subunit I [Thermodesulfovibrio thiophilus]